MPIILIFQEYLHRSLSSDLQLLDMFLETLCSFGETEKQIKKLNMGIEIIPRSQKVRVNISGSFQTLLNQKL